MMFSRKPAKNYFIDSENVNDVWVANIVNDLGTKDHIYIFYSENSTHMKSDSVRRLMELGADRVTWIRCYIGTNALDFQLVTVLGAVASDGKGEDEFIIVSNDAGFDAVVQFWQDQGREVSRLKMDTSAGRPKRQNYRGKRMPARKFQSQRPDLQPAKQAATKQQPKPKSKPQPKQQTPKQQTPKQQPTKQQPAKQQPAKQAAAKQQPAGPAEVALSRRDQAILTSLCRSIAPSDAGQLHDALNTLLGAGDGMRLYNYVKSNAEEGKKLSGVLLQEKQARAVNYVQLIYAVAGTSEAIGNKMTEIYLTERSGGLQGINLAMVKEFGQDKAGQYYPDLKRHFRILEKINR